MKVRHKKLLSLLLSFTMLVSVVPTVDVHADSQRIITLGADLNDEQRTTVLKFFGVDSDDLEGIELIEVNNKEEHETLGDVVESSVIGTHTYSCAYIEPTMSGGIKIKTANLTYVTASTLYNALQTAGVENCNLIVTAPFEVSGTGALTGVYKAYKTIGNELDEEKQDLATEELILGSELVEEYGESTSDFISDVKTEAIENGKDLAEDVARDLVKKKASEYNINITDEDIDRVLELIMKLKDMDYDLDSFSKKLDDLQNKVDETANKVSEESKGLFEKIGDFFKSILDFFTNLFGGGSDDEEVDSEIDTEIAEPSIFDNVDTSIFQFDKENKESEESTEPSGVDTETSEPESSTDNPESEPTSPSETPIVDDRVDSSSNMDWAGQ